MFWKWLLLLLVGLGGPVAHAITDPFNITVTIAANSRAFSLPGSDVVHFVAPNGNDACNGTSAAIGTSGNCAWATAAHTMNCGDVIIAAVGTYSNDQFGQDGNSWGTVNNCPSTCGGIDGTGGIWFAILLCGGTDLGTSPTTACILSTNGGGSNNSFVEWENQDNWAIEGFNLVGNGSQTGLLMRPCRDAGPPNYTMHHFAIINNLMTNLLQGVGLNDCADDQGVATDFVDYIASVGNILQNANQNGICLGALDYVGLGPWDTLPGTHDYMYTNYAINNNSPCNNASDGEAFYIDTWDAHVFSQLAVVANNIGYYSSRGCVVTTYGAHSSPTPTFKIYNNTCFNNAEYETASTPDDNDFDLNTGHDGAPAFYILQNNIGYDDTPTSQGGIPRYPVGSMFSVPNITFGGTGSENVLKSSQTSCVFNAPGGCDPGFNVDWNDQTLPPGAQFYVNPSFTNVTDLKSNHLGVPNCSGFNNTTKCMGWNAITQTLTSLSVISDLRAGCTQCTGKGFQLPSVSCGESTTFTGSITGTTLTVTGSVTGMPISIGQQLIGTGIAARTFITAGSGTSWTVNNSQSVGGETMGATDYPYWLKGIVYLQWTGSSITQNFDLATLPCGL